MAISSSQVYLTTRVSILSSRLLSDAHLDGFVQQAITKLGEQVQLERLLEEGETGVRINRAVERALINTELIPVTPGNLNGTSYEYLDNSVHAGSTYYYWLEIVSTHGSEMIDEYVLAPVYDYLYIPLVIR